ncbi:carboxynorspermidine decarboxylase [Cerasicoccus arenae]|uniref:Carboxynorspermidine/carboxyspermidine decarboxylase n=1 Tax=Cerasicoccus arenae TaxID=424488 RepID=A0A8J3DFE6_9BACT|nr:carboxynorspermidine decarboxylase [Cerasicoccus arenae]MBK1857232.1 carboxynorspermidine decarboxylase [Cerasicoccus arenae]GHC00156.1 carboxynorspermidine/carboxyspermidine decarboxylase [Cerasicoccus arenae]
MSQDPTPPLTPERLQALRDIPVAETPSPCFVINLDRLEDNCRILASVRERTDAKVLLAQKGFSMHATYPLLARYLDGSTASGLHEALLAKEYFGKEVHVYSAAFKENEIAALGRFAHTLVFNSVRQWRRHQPALDALQRKVELGLRVNPEHSEVETDLYNPASPCSRLGITRAELDRQMAEAGLADLSGLDGLHFHALCEQDADALEGVAHAFADKFGDLIESTKLKWLNFGGGHHITRPGYDLDRLCRVVTEFKERYGLDIYLEPGEAVALHTGVLIATVLDVLEANGVQNAILDVSATCHMPDVLEMPYRPNILDAGLPQERTHTYRLGGPSCLAGDVIGDYSFDAPLEIGQRLVFLDMAHYTMVKTSTFNGVPLPSLATYSERDGLRVVRKFGYRDFAERLS